MKAAIDRVEKSVALMDRIGGMKHERVSATNGPSVRQQRVGLGPEVDECSFRTRLSHAWWREGAPLGQRWCSHGALPRHRKLKPSHRPRPHPCHRRPRRPADDDAEPSFVGPGGRVGDGFSYLRQSLWSNNAGAVPDVGDKPETPYTFGQVDDRFRVYASKTEWLPWLPRRPRRSRRHPGHTAP